MHFGIVGFLVLAAFVTSIASKDYIRGCYYTNWSQYRPGNGTFMPENIEPGMCSHIFYAFAAMDNNFNLISIEPDDLDVNGKPGLYNRVNAIKSKQHDLKTLLSFGGYLFSINNVDLMRKMLSSVDNRKHFIDSAIKFVREHKFDGFDFNWYPENVTRDEFSGLVKEFRQAIVDETSNSTSDSQNGTRSKLLLTVGVPPGIDRIEAGYDAKNLSDSADWLNVMAFDYHSPPESQIGFNAPLVDRNDDGLSINSTIDYLLHKQQVPKEKLVLGMAAYGHGWLVSSKSAPNSIPSPALGASPAQPFTDANGTAAYFEICDLIEKSNYVATFDDVQKCPSIFKDGVWFGYDNQKSFEDKLDWLIRQDLAGAFVWSLDLDDFNGQCVSSNGKYPLVKVVQSKLAKQ